MIEGDQICVFEVFEEKGFGCLFRKIGEREMRSGGRIYFLLVWEDYVGTAGGFKMLEKVFGAERKTMSGGTTIAFRNEWFGG